MQLKPLDSPELIRLVADWLGRKENYQWLDFGEGRQLLTPEWLKIMTQRDSRVLRVYTSDDGKPIGVVGLEDVNRTFKTARIWVVAGEKAYGARGYATRATSKMLTLAFRELGLHAVNTWLVENNPSIHVAERVKFKPIGRQRQCHYIDGRVYDRLWFDILASEHTEIADPAPAVDVTRAATEPSDARG
jgi:RimJ/RimL family protein N-acetyltransferase